jgi:hypothetical protein
MGMELGLTGLPDFVIELYKLDVCVGGMWVCVVGVDGCVWVGVDGCVWVGCVGGCGWVVWWVWMGVWVGVDG